MMSYFWIILGLLSPTVASAYPEFVGYKYSSCLTCHYNSQGNGAINDYGRALWSAEIAANPWGPAKTDEELAESSGFLGKKELPWWVRPGVKIRQLWYQVNPGTEDAKTTSILMQADANAAFMLDQSYKYIFMVSLGLASKSMREQEGKDVISREHYFRWQARDDLFVFAGKMDKAYGIRIVDHTAYSRVRTGVAQNDQTHGVMVHWIRPNFEVTVHGFVGDLEDDSDLQEKGVSTLFEYEIRPAWRVGSSLSTSSTEYATRNLLGLHSRQGFGHGSSILIEAGLIDDSPKGAKSKLGYYLFSQGMMKLVRGYHLFITGEAFGSEMTSQSPADIRTGLGMMAFPMARSELRVEAKNRRSIYSSEEVPKDDWTFMAQLHLSL